MQGGANKPEAELKNMLVSVETVNPVIYQADKYVEPRVATIFVKVLDGETNMSVEGARVVWESNIGFVDRATTSTQTDGSGIAKCIFYSFEMGKAVIKAQVMKEGFAPCEALAEIEVVKITTRLTIVNDPPLGEIFLNGKKVGEKTAELLVSAPGIYVISWGDVEGYIAPDPVKIYINPDYSTEPMRVEGVYRRPGDRDFVYLRVYTCITFDDMTGVPNPIPGCPVWLSDGQQAVTDQSGMAVFKVKANIGRLKITAKHPKLYENYQTAEVDVGEKDLHVNLDFGIFFGGEAVIGFSEY